MTNAMQYLFRRCMARQLAFRTHCALALDQPNLQEYFHLKPEYDLPHDAILR